MSIFIIHFPMSPISLFKPLKWAQQLLQPSSKITSFVNMKPMFYLWSKIFKSAIKKNSFYYLLLRNINSSFTFNSLKLGLL